MKPKSVPAVKLRSRNRAGFTKGALAVKVCVRNSQNAEPLTTASMRISPEPNHSSARLRRSAAAASTSQPITTAILVALGSDGCLWAIPAGSVQH
jgi:hypothetical protein